MSVVLSNNISNGSFQIGGSRFLTDVVFYMYRMKQQVG